MDSRLTTRQFAFPRPYRLTKTDDFSSVFGFRRAIRGQMLMLHYLPKENPDEAARLGLVVGKKLLKQAVGRNLVKRLAREQFRQTHARLHGYDILLRLIAKPGKIDRKAMAEEIRQLLGKLRERSTSRPEQTEKQEKREKADE